MKSEILTNVLKEKTYQVPNLLIKNHNKLGLKDNDLIVLIYLINQPVPIPYNHKSIALNVDLKDMEALSAIHELQELGLIKLDITTNKNNKKEESLNVSPLYEKLSELIIKNNDQENQESIFSVFEKEFARTLSPMEYEIINSWINSKMDYDLIISALKEAVFNGVNNLRYIDKILYEWNKAGIKKPEDVKQKQPKIKKEELFDYNWLEE